MREEGDLNLLMHGSSIIMRDVLIIRPDLNKALMCVLLCLRGGYLFPNAHLIFFGYLMRLFQFCLISQRGNERGQSAENRA